MRLFAWLECIAYHVYDMARLLPCNHMGALEWCLMNKFFGLATNEGRARGIKMCQLHE